MNIPDDLCIGDILLYNTTSLINEVIDWKTGDLVAHVEIYVGGGQSVASRNGIGVGQYPFRPDGLVKVRRPVVPLNYEFAGNWFNHIKGMQYDYEGLLACFNMDKTDGSFICSTFASMYFKIGKSPMFADDYLDAKVVPRDFVVTRMATTIWSVH